MRSSRRSGVGERDERMRALLRVMRLWVGEGPRLAVGGVGEKLAIESGVRERDERVRALLREMHAGWRGAAPSGGEAVTCGLQQLGVNVAGPPAVAVVALGWHGGAGGAEFEKKN